MICCHCLEDKPESEFYNDKSKPSGKKPRCKPCDKLSVDMKRRAEYEKNYYSKPENSERKKGIVRASMKKNAEKYADKRREYLKTDAGSAMYRRYTQKRYAVMKNAFVEEVDPYQIYQQQGGICYICKGNFTFKEMELDHVVPLARGGKHENKNCKMACAFCNRSKGAKLLEELTYQVV